MAFEVRLCEAAPLEAELRPLLEVYYGGIAARLAAIGGPVLPVEPMVQGTLDDLGDYLPPLGALFVARDGVAGPMIGHGFLRRLDARRGEMKRLFVKPEAQGAGLGRRLTEARIVQARQMGLTELYADTVRGNHTMLAMYERLGFRECGRYAGNANAAELDRYLVYRKLVV